MVNCKVCGKEITAEDEFCPHCGMRVQQPAPVTAPAEPAQAKAPEPIVPPAPPQPDMLNEFWKKTKPKLLTTWQAARDYLIANKKRVAIIGGIAALAVVCIISVSVVVNVAIPAFKYSKGETLLSGGRYEDAITAFAALGDYKDAAEREKDAKYQQAGKLLTDQYYNLAIDLYNELGSYKDTPSRLQEAQYQKARSLISSEDYVGAIAVLEKIKGYKDANALAQEAKYRQAKNLLSAKDYMEAYTAFDALGGYKDSAQLKAPLQYTLVKARQINAIQFGTCEWTVLKVEGNKALVIAKGFVANKPEEEVEPWLNGEFYNLFSAEEKARIITTGIEVDGTETNKRVWLLSESEARTYFTTDELRKVGSQGWYLRNGFVSKNGVINYDKNSDEWGFSGYGYFNISSGSLAGYGNYLKAGNYGVRPALWINLETSVVFPQEQTTDALPALKELDVGEYLLYCYVVPSAEMFDPHIIHTLGLYSDGTAICGLFDLMKTEMDENWQENIQRIAKENPSFQDGRQLKGDYEINGSAISFDCTSPDGVLGERFSGTVEANGMLSLSNKAFYIPMFHEDREYMPVGIVKDGVLTINKDFKID